MYSLATVRTLFSALRSELCSIGTGVTEKVTKTFHSFLGSSSPVDSGVREPVGASWVGLSWNEWWSSWVKWMGSVSTSIRGVRFTPYILDGNEWFRFPRHSVSGSILLGWWPGTRGVVRVPPQGAPGACGGPCFCVVFAFLAWPCTRSPKVPSGARNPNRTHEVCTWVCSISASLHSRGMDSLAAVPARDLCSPANAPDKGYSPDTCHTHPACTCQEPASHLGNSH